MDINIDDHVNMEEPILHPISCYEYSSVWPNLPPHQLNQFNQIPSSSFTLHHVPPPSSTDHQLIADNHHHHPDNSHHHQVLLAGGNSSMFMELDDQDEDDQKAAAAGEEELGAMKEMMYKIAAMQPVDIDPATIRKPKRRNVRISDDPQSVAARHRRERISEKIRILQRLVPGGTKMDTASMLDEAICYVKFLKRQIRLLQSSSSNNANNINIDGHQHDQHHTAPLAAAHDDHDQCNINIINDINGSSSVGTTGAGLPLDHWPSPNYNISNINTVPYKISAPHHRGSTTTTSTSSSTRHLDH